MDLVLQKLEEDVGFAAARNDYGHPKELNETCLAISKKPRLSHEQICILDNVFEDPMEPFEGGQEQAPHQTDLPPDLIDQNVDERVQILKHGDALTLEDIRNQMRIQCTGDELREAVETWEHVIIMQLPNNTYRLIDH